MNNILFITRVDRTAIIIEMKEYIRKNNINCRIVVLSDNINCPSKAFADDFVIMSDAFNQDTNYLLDLIHKYKIKGIFAASSFDIKILLEIKHWLIENDVNYFSPDEETLRISLSKNETFSFLTRNKIATPTVYKMKHQLVYKYFPLILKPDYGQGSDSVYIVSDANEFNFYYNRISKPVVQQYISGNHYTIDCFNDLNGVLKIAIPRKRIVIDGANSSVSAVVIDQEIKELANVLSNKLSIVGVWNFQLIKDEHDCFIHDINPRLASGLIYSIMSGVPFQKYIVDSLLFGYIDNWEYNLVEATISRYKSFVVV